ncbi:MAG TPA: GH92 family glycosyl hydrolase [Candidatus Krumholzibacteria bacterium]|nr:GH92 family glycosyl hydrolase [Candidatus Krumholzibacteria bacterium]
MTVRIIVLAVCAAVLAAARPAPASSLADHVDPFIGTGGHGHTFPGPSLPFGMVQLSPDTRLTGWDGCSAYHFSDTVVYGFSHTHLSGTGVPDYGDILLMPLTGEPQFENGYPDRPDQGYGSRFRKETERARAGWYAVRLDDYGIDVELTATARTGLHRYVLPKGKAAHVIIDLRHRDELVDADLALADDRTVTGFRRSSAWARDQLVHFRAAFSRPFTASRIVTDDQGRAVEAVLSFGDAGGELLVQVGLSAVDDDGARRNLEAEWAAFDFNAVKKAAAEAWATALDRVEADGLDDAQRTVLATALYHAFLVPNLFSDVDGRYRGMDLAVHQAVGRDQYTVFSLWDTYRAEHPLFTLLERRRTRDLVRTMLSHYEQGGRLPVWELAANETDCMIGYHAVPVIADAWLKGIAGVDGQAALDAMIDSADRDHFGLDAYKAMGFIPADREAESVSKTLEYAYDDWTIAKLATTLGRTDVADRFARRSQGWRHLLDPATGCFRPRPNGQWLTPYDPRRVDNNHTEANGWQYRFAAPHDLAAHIAALGGDEAYTAALDTLFTTDSATTGREQPDISGLIGQYAHGNEPSHHVAWLYHGTGHPDRTAHYVGRILREFYAPRPDGLIGNEDCGQMSAWYVLAACGLYDIAPGSLQWLVIPPLAERLTLRFEDGRTFTTRRTGKGDFVRSVAWNGEPLTRSWLSHAEVTGGGELVFAMGDRPGAWGRAPADRPGAPLAAAPIVPAPWAAAPADRFRGRQEVTLHVGDPQATLAWATDRDPEAWQAYDGPIVLDRTTTLRFRAERAGAASPIVSATFTGLPADWTVTLGAVPNPQYTAGGPDALIDGRRGAPDWRNGGWQGYEGTDVVVTLDLGRSLPVTRAGLGCLQDMRSWILLPTEVRVETSADGVAFTPAGRVGHTVPQDLYGLLPRDLMVDLDGAPVRALRFTAPNAGVMPAWHPGAGGASFVFIDEILVETAEASR